MTSGPLTTVAVPHSTGAVYDLPVEPWGPDLAIAPALNELGGFAVGYTVLHVRSALALACEGTYPFVCLPCARLVLAQLIESGVDWSAGIEAINADRSYLPTIRRAWGMVDGCVSLHGAPG